MAPLHEGTSDFDEAERARFRKKLDGYEAMGLDVNALRSLLEEDLEAFKETYLADIKAQLGADQVERPEEAPEEEEGPPEEALDEEILAEELELQMEGAGPEEALAAIEPPEEDTLEEPSEEEVKIAYEKMENSYSALKDVQMQLIYSERMAFVGNIVRGIADELNNPLADLTLMTGMLTKKLEKDINTWINNNKRKEIVDIKYQVTGYNTYALIIYWDK